jgi:O-antigen/teichoic acid export membrane protein
MSLLKLVIKNSFLYAIPTVLTRGINFFSALLYTLFLTPAEYGSFEIYVLTVSILAIIITLDISSAVGRLFSESNEKEKKLIFNTAFYAILFFGVFITLAINEYLLIYIFKEINYSLALMAVLNIFVYAIYYFLKMQFRWSFQETKYIFVVTSTSSLMILIAALGLIFYEQSIEVVIFANLCAHIYGVVVSIILHRKLFAPIFEFRYFKILITFSTPLIPAALIAVSLMFVDRIMIDYYMGIDSVGVYSLGVRFSGLALICYIGVDLSMSPILYSSHKNKEAKLMLARIFRIFIFIAPIAIGSILFFTNSYFMVFEKQEFIKIKDFLMPLILASLITQSHLFFPGLWIAKKTYIFFILSLSAFFINIILNYFWINLYGLQGAGFSSLVSYLFLTIVNGILSQIYYPVDHSFKKIFTYSFFSITVTYLFFYLVDKTEIASIIIGYFALLLYVISIAYFLNIINLSDFRKFKATIKSKFNT